MPWIIKNNCVYKKNNDGSLGELLGCHETKEMAQKHLRALYANVKDSLHELPLYISKSSIHNGEMRWWAVNSDTDWDLYGERMSLSLFENMLSKIKQNVPPPIPFSEFVTSDYWKGGMPYLSIAHYSDGNGHAVPGEVKEIFIDGNRLKARGILYNSKLGSAVWKSLKEDEFNNDDAINRIRISIAFLDLAHKHGDSGQVFERRSLGDICPDCKRGIGDKIYLDGYLVHLALTRVPVNPRTIIMPEEEIIMAKKSKITTRKQDALSIVQDEALVEELESEALKSRSLGEDTDISEVLVEMSDADNAESLSDASSNDTEGAIEERSDVGTESPSVDTVWRPYGGATSMTEAMERDSGPEEYRRASELYHMFMDVSRNIMEDVEIKDKAAALDKVLEEFKSLFTAKSLITELSATQNVAPKYVIRVDTRDFVNEVQELRSLVNNLRTNNIEFPLELEVQSLYNAISEALANKSLPEEGKLMAIQPALDGLGEGIRKLISNKSNPLVEEAPQESATNNIAELVNAINELSQAVQVMGGEISTIKARINNSANDQRSTIPAPRSLVIPPGTPPSNASPKPTSVREVVRRSVYQS